MNHLRQRISGLFAAMACMALLTVPALADDPRIMAASPVLLPGANQLVCDQIQRNAAYTSQMNIVARATTMQQPTSFSSCLQGLLSQFHTLTSLFSGGFSFSGLIDAGFQNVVQGILTNLEQQACQAAGGVFKSVENGMIVHVSVTNIMGHQVGATLQATPNSNNNTPTTPAAAAAQQVAQDSSEPDDLDNIANSMGTTLTAATLPSNTLPGPDYVTQDDSNPPPPPRTFTMTNPSASPNNATICMLPDMRNDLSQDTATLDGDSPLLNPANYATPTNPGSPVNDGSTLAMLGGGSSAPPSGNPVVPQANTPNPGDTPSGNSAPSPAASNAASSNLGCSPFNAQQSTPGKTSTGTNCTANTKLSCVAGSGCSPQNNGIGYAKDYQNGSIISHGPYGSGANLGQCAQLTQFTVPNTGHTTLWRRGPSVQNNATLQFGTPIATFFGPAPTGGATKSPSPGTVYQYQPGTPNVYEQHTGLFMGYTNQCMFILEEYHGLPAPHIRCMEWGHAWDGTMASLTRSKANEMHAAVNYYVIVH